MIFRDLSPQEEEEFKAYAEANDPPDMASWDLYHPVCRKVWQARGVSPKHIRLGDFLTQTEMELAVKMWNQSKRDYAKRFHDAVLLPNIERHYCPAKGRRESVG